MTNDPNTYFSPLDKLWDDFCLLREALSHFLAGKISSVELKKIRRQMRDEDIPLLSHFQKNPNINKAFYDFEYALALHTTDTIRQKQENLYGDHELKENVKILHDLLVDFDSPQSILEMTEK